MFTALSTGFELSVTLKTEPFYINHPSQAVSADFPDVNTTRLTPSCAHTAQEPGRLHSGLDLHCRASPRQPRASLRHGAGWEQASNSHHPFCSNSQLVSANDFSGSFSKLLPFNKCLLCAKNRQALVLSHYAHTPSKSSKLVLVHSKQEKAGSERSGDFLKVA